jgi:glycosyltransferase involved in cell wall biosynthesis
MLNAPANAALIPSALISAVVPARNEEASIAACIESLACQPEINQILVVNDQSTEPSPSGNARRS